MKAFLILLLLFPLALSCVKVDVSVNKETLSTNDPLIVTLRITDSSRLNLPEPQAPDIKLFRFRNVTSSSSSSVVLNGLHATSEYILTYRYIYFPTATGSTSVPAITLRVDNRDYQTSPISLSVVKASQSQPSQSAPSPPARNPFGFFSPQPDAFSNNQGANCLLLALPKTQVVYRGFPAVVSYYLYAEQMARSFNLEDEQDYSGYGKSTFEQPSMLNYEDANLGGKYYKRALIKRLAIMPNIEGELQAPQLSGVVKLSDIGFYSQTLESQGGLITVRPLPRNNVPAGFNGAVGNFTLSHSISATELSLGEALTFTLKISGRGNFNQFVAPLFASGKGFQVSSPMAVDNLNAGIDGSRTYYYTIIPQNKGVFPLPQLNFVWFANDLGEYKTYSVPAITVSVKSASALSYLNRLLEPRLPRSMLPKLARLHYPVYKAYPRQAWFWVLFSLILSITAFISGLALDRKLQMRNPERYARQKAERILIKYMKPAIAAAQNLSLEFYPLAEKALFDYLVSKYQLSNRFSTQEKIAALSQKHVPQTLLDDLQTFLNKALEARFLPETERALNLQEDLSLLKQIVAGFSRLRKQNNAELPIIAEV